MTNQERRKQVIEACIAAQQHIADVAKQEMDSAQQQSNDYGANVDRYDSYRTKMMRNRDMYARQYSNALAGVRHLQELLRCEMPSMVAHGSCVVTDTQRYLLSIGAGKFMVGREVWFAISAQAPIYAALQGKSVGDELFINGQYQTIRDLF